VTRNNATYHRFAEYQHLLQLATVRYPYRKLLNSIRFLSIDKSQATNEHYTFLAVLFHTTAENRKLIIVSIAAVLCVAKSFKN
jgi:hypothetical protein